MPICWPIWCAVCLKSANRFVNQLVNPEVPAQSMAKDPREAALSADSPIELPSDMFVVS